VTEQRILLTTDVVGGVWDFCAVLARELRASAQVTLLAFGVPTPAHRRTAAAIGVDLRSVPLKLEWMQDAAADMLETRQVVKDIARQLGADVIHANQFAAACADVVEVPVVLTLHSDVLSWRRWTYATRAVPAEWQAYAALVREALARADAVVAVSAFLAREIARLYAADRSFEVIHNGWPSPPPPGARHDRITLAAGRIWDAAKNIPLAAEAARGWDAGEVYLAGETTHPDGGQAEVPQPLQPLGVLDRARMDGWLRRASVYLSTARYDPFGLLPLQAALNGCALLLSDIPSYRELWDGAACFFRSNDAADLRRQWQLLLDDPHRLQGLQGAAYRRASTRYTAEAMAGAYRGVYTRVRKHVAA
jgi:glycosyltransferase involved in cell wall biosynthesis